MSEPLPPSYVRMCRQNGSNPDCVVVSLAMLFNVNYEESLAACLIAVPDVLERGMHWTEIRRACDILGGEVKLVRRGFYDLDDATGILNVKRKVKRESEDHAVFLWAGRVIEAGTEGWLDAEDYLRHYGYTPYSLLVRVG